MLGFDKIFEMQGSEGPLPGEGEEIEKVSLVALGFISPDMFQEKRGPLKTLNDFEMVIPDRFVRRDIFRPDPWRFQELHRVRQFSIEAKVAGILEITIIILLVLSRGMAIMVHMFEVVGALPETDIVDDQLQMALDRFLDGF